MQQSGHPAPDPVNGPFGFVVIDKPAGLTSHACVSRLRRSYGLKRVGHGGTLDPAVTGVLPIALGPATRLLPYLPGEKTYTGVIQLGRRTSSDDLEGELLDSRPGHPSVKPSSTAAWRRSGARLSSVRRRSPPYMLMANGPMPRPGAVKPWICRHGPSPCTGWSC